MKKCVLLIGLLLLVLGCADTHRVDRKDLSGVRLSPQDTILIALPADGSYGEIKYTGSGRQTAQIINAAFAKHTTGSSISNAVQTIGEASLAAREAGYKYLIYPTILHWEDRATEWSGLPDRVEIKIEIVEVQPNYLLGSMIVIGKSGLFTFGGDHPQDLLPEPVGAFVSSLY
jgi:hypothetical protein